MDGLVALDKQFNEFENSMNTIVDTKYKNGYRQYEKSKFCGKHWNEIIKLNQLAPTICALTGQILALQRRSA